MFSQVFVHRGGAMPGTRSLPGDVCLVPDHYRGDACLDPCPFQGRAGISGTRSLPGKGVPGIPALWY